MLKDFQIFKTAEAEFDTRLEPDRLVVLRLDGSNFSSLTRQWEKPFSAKFEAAVDAAAAAVLKSVLPTALATYAASDEISLILSTAGDLPYAGRTQKLLSLSAAHATAGFLRALPTEGVPAFDARLLPLQEPAHIREYLTWRRLDCRKNATSMAAGFLHSHKELHGVSTRTRGDLLAGTAFEKIPESTFNGRFLHRNQPVEVASRDRTEEVAAAAVAEHHRRLYTRG